MIPVSRSIVGMAIQEPSGVSVRVDEELGIREEVGFIGPDGERMFSCIHLPDGEVRGAVLIASPVHAEHVANYRREVLLARRIAAGGLAVLRFHYRGAGNSDGETTDLTYGSMTDDARRARDHLAERAGSDVTAYLGTRLGAVVAADVAGESSAGVALWEPILSGRVYLREIFRMSAMRELSQNREPRANSPEQELVSSGTVDVLGYPIATKFHEEVTHLELRQVLGGSPRPIVLAQIGTWSDLKTGYRSLESDLTDSGCDVSSVVITQPEAWWFPQIPHKAEESLEGTAKLIAFTEEWLRGLTHERRPGG
jgi:Serine aminopeptidase, S33